MYELLVPNYKAQGEGQMMVGYVLYAVAAVAAVAAVIIDHIEACEEVCVDCDKE